MYRNSIANSVFTPISSGSGSSTNPQVNIPSDILNIIPSDVPVVNANLVVYKQNPYAWQTLSGK